MNKQTELILGNARPADMEQITVSSGGATPGGPGQVGIAIASSTTGYQRDEPDRRIVGGSSPYLHAFRRHWFLAVTAGILCGAAAMVPAWFLSNDQYTATALLHVSVSEQRLSFRRPVEASTTAFEIFKGTQQQFLLSGVVLNAALRKPETANLVILEKEGDPAQWLARNLRIDYPGNAEIMRVA